MPYWSQVRQPHRLTSPGSRIAECGFSAETYARFRLPGEKDKLNAERLQRTSEILVRCQGKSPLSVVQLRFTPIVGVANVDGIRIQLDKILYPQRETLFQRNERRECFQVVGSGRLNAQIGQETFQVLFSRLLTVKNRPYRTGNLPRLP